MIIGILSDAHGNYIGLKTCLDYLLERSDKIIFLGDAVGYFPFPDEVLDQLRTANAVCIMGNHDAMLLDLIPCTAEKERIYRLIETKEKISSINRHFLTTAKRTLELQENGKRLLFVHGSPTDPLKGYVYPDTELTQFDDIAYDVVFMGHTHRSFVRKEKNKVFVNVGSCGLSRDNGNKVTAALYDTISGEVGLKHFFLDKETVIARFSSFVDPSVIDVLNRNNINET